MSLEQQPQRPTRTLRVYGDENILPTTAAQKTLHQRNKSSPSLSTTLQAGGLKMAAKRTAFGDVSNTANLSRPSKDDSVVGGKGGYSITEKVIPTLQDKKTTSFLRPAQRPISVGGIKGLLNNVTNSINPPSVKQPLVELEQSVQTTNQAAQTRKVVTKKSTAIFKDTGLAQPEQTALEPQKPPPSVALLAPVHRELLPRQRHMQTEVSQVPQPPLTCKPSEPITSSDLQKARTEPSAVQASSEEPPVLRSDGIYVDDQGQVRLYDYEEPTEPIEVARPAEKEVVVNEENPKQDIRRALDPILANQPTNTRPEPISKSTLAPVSEPEEYWDDEAEENFEEEGYATARSFRSRGENTTGGATTVLFPKVNQKAKKEIAAAKDLIEGSKTAEELEDEAWDTTMVAEYGEEIFGYMKDLEIKMLPNAHYMDNQAEIQWSMRSVLMDWIVQVHHRFNLLPETLFLCVNYIDRFLSCKVVSLGKLQLVGATAIFIAAKYEEIDCPSVQEIVYMVDGGYTIDEILKAERFMLSMLQFELGWPGPMSFLRRISKADDYDLETRTLAKYFLEITIMDERFVGSPPSFVAAGAHCLARMMLKKGHWSPAHVYYSNYTYSQIISLVSMMVECCEDARKHHAAIYDKYLDKRYKRASQFAETEMRRGFEVLDVNTSSLPSYAGLYEDRNVWGQK
ncbi:G2/mitotic-specific cyclin 3/4, partial [Lecanoromycetidae sp. Uapishka_2]